MGRADAGLVVTGMDGFEPRPDFRDLPTSSSTCVWPYGAPASAPRRFPAGSPAWPTWTEPASILAHADHLEKLAAATADAGLRDERAVLAAEFDRIAAAIEAGPRVPGEDELIARFVAGEIGDRPHALDHGLGPHRSHRGLRAGQAPPMQMVEDGLPRAFPLLPPGGGDDGNRKTKEGKDDD
jgi:hypothetical protein